MGPFRLVSLIDNGNATVQADDSGSRPAQRWTVRWERIVPYRYDYICYDATTLNNINNITPAVAGI